MKAFLDSNIFLRFFVPEDDESYVACSRVLKMTDEGRIRPYTSPIVLLECEYVLSKYYKFPNSRVLDAIERIAHMRNMTIVSSMNGKKALKLWADTGVKFADCLIVSQIGKGITLVTYDQEFRKIPGLTVMTPEIISVENAE